MTNEQQEEDQAPQLPELCWTLKDFEPEDEAPKGDPELDCTGEGDDDDAQ